MRRFLNQYIFIKNGYSACKHVVPFSIAALLLLLLSLPADNLLLKLAELLQQPSWKWLIALFLTVAAAAVYFFTIRVQVRQAYLRSAHNLRRTIITSVTYVVVCSLMAFVVLHSAIPKTNIIEDITLGNVWASLLIAVLSLTGVGWSGPGSWVEYVGIKSPNYEEGHRSANRLTVILERVRRTATAEAQEAQDFLEAAKGLRSSVDTNIDVEPEWAKEDLHKVRDALDTLIDETEQEYAKDDRIALSNFVAACRCEEPGRHGEFINALKTLSNYWDGWKCV